MERIGSSGGGCCIARYTHPHTTTTSTTTNYNPSYTYNTYHDMSKMDRVMLRFRPIAPKPTIFSTTESTASNDDVQAKVGKRRRKSTNKSPTKRRKSLSPDHDRVSNGDKSCHVVTLPLLPETPDLSPRENVSKKSAPTWLCFGPSDQGQVNHQTVVQSSVMVEGVTDTWVDGNGLGRTDEEKMRTLDDDTCPAFISDGWSRVWWSNSAYKRMVTVEAPEDTWWKERVVVVRLEMREKVELSNLQRYPAFTCRVRVEYGNHMMVVPCDVWKMNGGGFAWRLDVKAALTLSLSRNVI